MSLIPQFVAQRAAFEEAYQTGQWHLLSGFFADDLVYEVLNMPFHCRLEGRAAVISGLQRSVERFDQLCRRTVGIGAVIREEGANVLVNSGIRFERDDAPPIEVRLWEIATYHEGKIRRLMDIYDAPDHDRFAEWMAEWGEGLDPSYA
ncbi:MAG: hypothetical protein ACK41C_12260 [Phenylobacterium sp.]|uniref:hypothetical protein n=1 Tax=Phenylobacterium sp. TaxID=1871053 RepID=UPI00391DBF1B